MKQCSITMVDEWFLLEIYSSSHSHEIQVLPNVLEMKNDQYMHGWWGVMATWITESLVDWPGYIHMNSFQVVMHDVLYRHHYKPWYIKW